MNKKDLEKLGFTAEALEKAGLSDDVLDKIIVLHGKDIEDHKTQLSTAAQEAEALKAQLVDANKQIDSFKGMKIEEIQKAAADWEAKAKQAETDAAAKVSALKFDHALESALSGAKAKNPKAVKALLDMENLKLNDSDGSIIGLDDQLKKVKGENDYLFTDEAQTPKIVTQTNGTSISNDAFGDALLRGAGIKKE